MTRLAFGANFGVPRTPGAAPRSRPGFSSAASARAPSPVVVRPSRARRGNRSDRSSFASFGRTLGLLSGVGRGSVSGGEGLIDPGAESPAHQGLAGKVGTEEPGGQLGRRDDRQHGTGGRGGVMTVRPENEELQGPTLADPDL